MLPSLSKHSDRFFYKQNTSASFWHHITAVRFAASLRLSPVLMLCRQSTTHRLPKANLDLASASARTRRPSKLSALLASWKTTTCFSLWPKFRRLPESIASGAVLLSLTPRFAFSLQQRCRGSCDTALLTHCGLLQDIDDEEADLGEVGMSSKHTTTSAAASPYIGEDGVFKNNQQHTVTIPTAFGSMGPLPGTGRGAFGSGSRVRGSQAGTATPTTPTHMSFYSYVSDWRQA